MHNNEEKQELVIYLYKTEYHHVQLMKKDTALCNSHRADNNQRYRERMTDAQLRDYRVRNSSIVSIRLQSRREFCSL